MRALADAQFSPELAFDRRQTATPLRNELLPDSQIMASYGDRLCAGGTNILLAFRRPDRKDFTFRVKRRSKTVSTGRGVFSLIPSGMHQPATVANAHEESSIAATVYREIFEELFGGKEVEAHDKHLEPLWFMSKPQLDWFRHNRRSYTLEIVSFGLNLLDGTFEFGVLLAVHDEKYWKLNKDAMKPNAEFDDTETRPFFTSDTDRLTNLLTVSECADTSLIALVEGLRRLRQLEPSRVKLPDIEIIK